MRVTSTWLVALALGLGACGTSEPVSRTIGARCDLSSECDERCLAGGEYPGGFCSVTCDSAQSCPGGSSCADEQSGGVCLFTCALDADCAFLGTGWRCQERDAHPTGAGKVMVCRGG